MSMRIQSETAYQIIVETTNDKGEVTEWELTTDNHGTLKVQCERTMELVGLSGKVVHIQEPKDAR